MILYQGGGATEDTVARNRLFKKYPRFEDARPEITVYNDPEYTREKTGAGSVEYYGPTQESIRYPSGYAYAHPSYGRSAILRGNDIDQQGVNLDAFHGIEYIGPTARKLKYDFDEAVGNSPYQRDIDIGWSREQMKPYENDGYESYRDNEIDGMLRNLAFEGTEEDFRNARYWDEARKTWFQDPGIKDTYDRLTNYLETE